MIVLFIIVQAIHTPLVSEHNKMPTGLSPVGIFYFSRKKAQIASLAEFRGRGQELTAYKSS